MKRKTVILFVICAAAITINGCSEETEDLSNDTALTRAVNGTTVTFSNRTATIVENSPELEFD